MYGGLEVGKTVLSYRMALEVEIAKWKDFRAALPSQEDQRALDEIMDSCRANAMAGGNATNPIIFEPMFMSIALSHQKQIRELEKKSNALEPQTESENRG
jgi:hypothetical protein